MVETPYGGRIQRVRTLYGEKGFAEAPNLGNCECPSLERGFTTFWMGQVILGIEKHSEMHLNPGSGSARVELGHFLSLGVELL